MALCTFNGERYLSAQLDSILHQTRLPDEVVVCDDRSVDSTMALVHGFQEQAPFPVTVQRNSLNLGSTANFDKAICLCTGDVIALCDQDDVWLPHKLSTIERAFSDRPHLTLVFSDADLIDEFQKPLGRRLWSYTGYDVAKQRRVERGEGFEVMRERIVTTGAAIAFRSELRRTAHPIPTDLTLMIHDGWLTMLAAATGEIAHISDPLLLYRRHSDQQVGVTANIQRTVRAPDHYQDHIRFLEALLGRLGENEQDQKSVQNVASLKRQMHHLQTRADLPKNSLLRAAVIFRELLLLRYQKYSNGVVSAGRDLLYARAQSKDGNGR